MPTIASNKQHPSFTGPISPKGLRQIDAYKYQTHGSTKLDDFMNTHWWERVVTWMPMTIAPNMLTLIGTFFLMSQFLLAMVLCPTLQEPMPVWALLWCSLCNFVYQTLDAIDGKQARRTKSSSALGQLFDHGCDSVSTLLIALPLICCLRLGITEWTVMFMATLQAPFFLAQWEEKHTHMIRTNQDGFGVTEAQFICMSGYIIGAIFGQNIWIAPINSWFFVPSAVQPILAAIGVGGIQLNHIIAGAMFASSFFMAIVNIRQVTGKLPLASQITAFSELLPLIWLTVWAAIWQQTASFPAHAWLNFSALGAAFSHMTTQMIVCAMSHTSFKLYQPAVFPLPLMALSSYAYSYLGKGVVSYDHFVDVLSYSYTIFVTALLLNYVLAVLKQLTHFLGIHALSLKKPSYSAGNVVLRGMPVEDDKSN